MSYPLDIESVLSRLGPRCRELVENRCLDLIPKLQSVNLDVSDKDLAVVRALASRIRLSIVALLSRSDRPVPLCLLTAVLGLDPQNLVYHLRILREAGIVREMNVGGFRFLELDRCRLAEALEKIRRISMGLQ